MYIVSFSLHTCKCYILPFVSIVFSLQVQTTLQHPTQYHVNALIQKNVDQYLEASPQQGNHFIGSNSSPNYQSGTSPHNAYRGTSPGQYNGGFVNVSSAEINYEASSVYGQAQNMLNTNGGRDPLLTSNYQPVSCDPCRVGCSKYKTRCIG